jgi:teichoic acid transport system permease protein
LATRLVTTTDYEAIAREAGLQRVGARPPLFAYLKEFWNRRHFAYALARYRIQASYGDNRFGLAWVVLQPIFQACVYGLVFGLIMPKSSRPENFIPFLVAGVFIFRYFASSFTGGASSITGNASLVRSLSFPRMLLPFAHVLKKLFELIPIMFVLCVILVIFGEPVRWTWFIVVVILALMTVFNTGIALIAARLTVHFADTQMFLPYIIRLLFYASGIFYSLEVVLAGRHTLLTIAELNPVHSFIGLVRAQMVTGMPQNSTMWLVAVGSAVVTFTLGVIFFWQAEEEYGRD